ncbi:DAK2 domain-containing protein, partial [Burkholderia sp. LMG 13014]|uniref:DAK2 domain-containing protein n=1 Tax=Burkholderia sp. LMG 13014 TaxID=2709306 RepID=UPI0019648590
PSSLIESTAPRNAAAQSRAGRARYLGARAIGTPDGGAVAVSYWLRALQTHIG